MKPLPLYVLAVIFLLLATGIFFYTRYSFSLGPAECGGVRSFLTDDPQCRWPPVLHYGFKFSLALMLASLLGALITRRKHGSYADGARKRDS